MNLQVKKCCIAAIIIGSLIGCGKKEEAPSPEMVTQVITAQQNAAFAEKQRQQEEKLRQDAERQKKIADEEKSKAEYTVLALLVLVAIALFVGIAIGSSSRKDSAKKSDADVQ